jgi:DNA-binding HxlR family transcriptional regulator
MKCKNDGQCDMKYLFQILGSRWNLVIIWHLNDRALRFTELQKRMGDVNSKTITSHLRDLEKFQIINREIYPEVPPRVEYSLTDHGKAFLPVLEVIRAWGASLPPPREK